MAKKVLGIIICIIIIGTWYYYNNVFARTAAVITLVSKSSDLIKVRFESGEEKEVRVPTIILPLLKEGEQYFVSIYQNIIRDPFIKKIEP